jgi:hypothetical protein
VQYADGLLLVNQERFRGAPEWTAGMLVFDLSEPLAPRELGRFDCGGDGVHRIVWTGGRYAYLSATPSGYDDRIWVIVDLTDPAAPVEAGRWWWPGQHRAAGERPDSGWPTGRRVAAHHALLDGELANLGYDDANLVVLDVSDVRRPRMVSNLRWDGGGTHTCLPLPGRRLVVATDEQLHAGPDAPERRIRVIDVADPARPRVLALCPSPEASWRTAGLRFGPHNLHENRPGTWASERLVFATWFNAGVRVYDLEDPARPVEIAHWVPTPAPGQPAAQSNDLLVDADGLVYVTDRVGGGLAVLEPERELAARMDRSRTSTNP